MDFFDRKMVGDNGSDIIDKKYVSARGPESDSNSGIKMPLDTNITLKLYDEYKNLIDYKEFLTLNIPGMVDWILSSL